jgi:hypothetical protein
MSRMPKLQRTSKKSSSASCRVPVRPLPRPARRARAVSAAIGRFDRTPSTEVQSKRPLQLVPLLRTTRWRLMEVTPQYVYQPHQPHRPGSHRRSSLPPDFLHRCARHARTHSLQPTALWGRLVMNLPLPHISSTPRRPRSSPRRRSGRCLPAAVPAPPNAHVHARPDFDPAAVAARRCRNGFGSQRFGPRANCNRGLGGSMIVPAGPGSSVPGGPTRSRGRRVAPWQPRPARLLQLASTVAP